MKRKILSLLILPLIAAANPAPNLWNNPGFETWDAESGFPTDSPWRWSIQKTKGGGEFEFLGQSSAEKHSGNFSLHIKDANPGRLNNVLYYRFSPREAKRLAGKILTMSGWVKQVRASAPKKVGLGIECWTADKQRFFAADWIDTAEPTGWTHLLARLKIPENAADLRAVLYCANNFNSTGEAFFDDILLTTGNVVKQQTETQETAAPSAGKHALFLPFAPAQHPWKNRFIGYSPEGNMQPGGFTLKRNPKQSGRLVIFELYTDLLNRCLDLSKVPQGTLGFRAKLSVNIPFWLNLIAEDGSKVTIKLDKPEVTADGMFLYRGTFRKHPASLRKISIHITRETLKDTEKISVSEIGLTAPENTPEPAFAASAWAENYIREYTEPMVVTDDGYQRPVIKDGTWFENGRCKFLLGPWIYNHNGDWRDPVRNNPLKIDHIAYRLGPGKELFDAMAFNSAQMSAAPKLPGQALYGLGIPWNTPEVEKNFSAFAAGFKGMSLVVDFAFSFDRDLAFQDPERRRAVDQRCGTWHTFLPACPEHPDGDRYYRDLMTGGTKILMKNKMNVGVYELFNESVYACQCSYNIRAFAAEMQKKYGSIKSANKIWNTIFRNFGELAASTDLQQYPGLWVEWWHFLAKRYGEVLNRYRSLVRSIDKRPNVYFCEMLAIGQVWNTFMDYRIVADVMDVLAIEGGWRYGHTVSSSAAAGMEAVVLDDGIHWYVCDFFAALAKGKKPVINNEHYCWRTENGLRVPSRRTDMTTSLWMEFMHGSSGNFTYVLDKRSGEYKTFEQAKKNVLHPSYKSSSLLNPYNWPPEELVGYRMFVDELEPYKEKLMPFPRTKAPTVAVYHSVTTLAMNQLVRGLDFRPRMLRWYSALLHNQYPVTFVFDNDLKRGLPSNIQALVIPCAEYETDETIDGIRKFAERGGIVIADSAAFKFDSHHRKRSPISTNFTRLNSRDSASVKPLLERLAKHNVTRYGTLEALDGFGPLEKTDLRIIDRGDFKFIFLAGMNDSVPRHIRLRLNLNAAGEFHLSDPVRKHLLLPASGEKWNDAQLRSGIELILPPQERVILVLERTKAADLIPWHQTEVRKEFQSRRTEVERVLKNIRDAAERKRKMETEARIHRNAVPTKCETVDLRKFVNMHWRDEKAGDRRGGGFDQGSKDFSAIRPGRTLCAGVPFDLIDADRNNGKGLIVLAGRERDYFPAGVCGIPVNRKAKNLYFLHTMGWGAPEGETVLTYKIHYSDDTEISVPVRSKLEIAPWMDRHGVVLPKLAKIGLESTNPEGVISFQNFCWHNPHPEKTIRSIDILSACDGGVPAIAAISAEKE